MSATPFPSTRRGAAISAVLIFLGIVAVLAVGFWWFNNGVSDRLSGKLSDSPPKGSILPEQRERSLSPEEQARDVLRANGR
jgi:hypothetical protein